MHLIESLSVPEGSAAIHWFEQSTYVVKDSNGTIVFVDPYFPRNRPSEKFVHPEPPHDESQLPVDFVILTHDHRDHTCIESLNRLHESFPNIRYFGPTESVFNMSKNTSIPDEQIKTITAGDVCELGSMKATAIYAKAPEGDPASNIEPPDVTHLGFVLEAGEVRIYFSGDVFHCFPNRSDLMETVSSLKPNIGFLTNHPTEGEFPFFEGSVAMAVGIGLETAAPAHYQCFVKRNYDPNEWASGFPADGPKPLIMPRNSHIIYPN